MSWYWSTSSMGVCVGAIVESRSSKRSFQTRMVLSCPAFLSSCSSVRSKNSAAHKVWQLFYAKMQFVRAKYGMLRAAAATVHVTPGRKLCARLALHASSVDAMPSKCVQSKPTGHAPARRAPAVPGRPFCA